MHATRSLIVECHLDEPPEKVWRALTVPEIVAAWLMPNDIEAKVGHRFTFKTKDMFKTKELAGGDIACEVLEVEPNRLLRYRWRGEADDRDARSRRSTRS